MPAEFLDRLKKQYHREDLVLVLKGLTEPRHVCFRINTLLGDTTSVLTSLEKEGIMPSRLESIGIGYMVPHDSRQALLESESYQARRIYIQNASSMVPPLVLAPRPGERVLDLAAAPGSKTLQLATLMECKGELAAVEVVKDRYYRLKRNLFAHGAGWARTFLQDGRKVWRFRPEYFDKILLDAPCSSEGRFNASDPDSTAYWKPRKIKEMTRKQRKLIYSAIHALRPGGELVYATCSLSCEENESIIAEALQEFNGIMRLESIPFTLPESRPGMAGWKDSSFPDSINRCLRILPGTYTEGFFIARLKKTGSSNPPIKQEKRY